MEINTRARTAVIVSTETLVSQLPRTKAAPGAFTKVKAEQPAADPLAFRKQRGKLVEAVKRTRKVAADLQ